MAEAAPKPLWRSDTARKVTVVLLVVQLVGCAMDVTSEQATIESLFCMATFADSSALEFAGFVAWLVLALSWIVGAFAIQFATLRPPYWMLLLAIPVAMVTQNALLQNQVFYCDGP